MMTTETSDEVPQVYVEADEIRRLPGPRPPDQLGRLGATIGAGLGFGGAILYAACWLLFQLAVRSSGATASGLMPATALWVTSLLAFLVFGTVSSVVFGAALGALGGALQARTWKSQSPLLAWTFGIVISLLLVMVIQQLMTARGLHVDLAEQLRFLTIPSVIFVVEGGLTGLLTRVLGQRRS